MNQLELNVFENGQLSAKLSPETEEIYPRAVANQLIRCARMNDWNKFVAMWKLKTSNENWEPLSDWISGLDSKQQWKLKEAFARQATNEEEADTLPQKIVQTLRLP